MPYTVRIPQRAMEQESEISLIVARLTVDGPMPVRFTFDPFPDTVHVSRTEAWYNVRIYPLDTSAQAVRV